MHPFLRIQCHRYYGDGVHMDWTGPGGGIMVKVTRRQFLAAATGVGALAAFGGMAPSAGAATKSAAKPKKPTRTGGITDPSKAPFDTVVVLMMENRSFDHLLGWMPGVNGKQAGLTYPDLHGSRPTPRRWGTTPRAAETRTPPTIGSRWPSSTTTASATAGFRPRPPETTSPSGTTRSPKCPSSPPWPRTTPSSIITTAR